MSEDLKPDVAIFCRRCGKEKRLHLLIFGQRTSTIFCPTLGEFEPDEEGDRWRAKYELLLVDFKQVVEDLERLVKQLKEVVHE